MHDETTSPDIRQVAGDLLHLPLARIVPSNTNPRLTLAKEPFHELKKSIAQNGLLQPILVRPAGNRYEIIGGHRRFAAVTELASAHPHDDRFYRIAAHVTDADDAKVAVLQLAENLNRADLSPLETAAGIAKAVAGGMSKEELAEALGWHARKVYRYVQLDAAPGWIKDFAKEVQVPVKRMENGAPVIDPVTNTPVVDFETLPGLSFTDLMELVVLHNALHDQDVAELKKTGRADFKPQAERVTRKLAYAAASEQWSTAKLREEAKLAKAPPAAQAPKKGATPKPAFTITRDSAHIDLARAAGLPREQREELAAKLVKALAGLGFAAVINPAR